ncbi:efflux RND transporter periplasmic adaptor subunit [Tamlana fucoidanivorans]|uniref:Efflux RND transporter periplasmic adaptor subunit n=1 Tax=Allotamlana fucoidanivorans TaxID=2583814 RepID=A0A5C4SRB0_9FLAO|nr:efflux RND transporter periplasmic adaptor subunit [Tamlana fucoidanivorans]TNJ46966.1 efflux RND transporter periplasmic adaptor subunit [Tamlana fucoidanivorans]
MKKYLVYIGVLALGLALGWVFFGHSSLENKTQNHDEVVKTDQMWTCSMHPQIMQPEAGDCPICGMDLIPVEVGADGLGADAFKMTKNAMALANIQTSIVGNAMVEGNTIKLSGKIAENEDANVVQASYFSGRIERLNISSVGEKVNKGQLLATIYSPELFSAQQELITAASIKASQPELYIAVRNKLKLWNISDDQINQIESSGKVQHNVPVYATVSGTVSEKLVDQGDYVKQGEALLKITDLNTVWALFDLYEHQIDLIKEGQNISITTNTYPNKPFHEKIDFIEPTLNPSTRTVKIRVVLNNTTRVFKPGMFIEGLVEVKRQSKEPLLTIPVSSVLWTGERSVVYVKLTPETPVFEMREVTLGKQVGAQYEVIEGLNHGDEIVVNGTFTVDAAAQLQGKKSMMNKEGGKTRSGHEAHLGIDHKTLNNTDYTKQNTRLETPSLFQQQLKKVYDNYIAIKDALVQDNVNKASESAKDLLVNLSQVDMKLLKNDAHTHWMSLEKEIKSSTDLISNTSNIEIQRTHFKPLSAHLISAIQLFGINEKVYVEFCPMADNNKGAYWLSKEAKVINPYFGDDMLTCGELKQVIE